MSDVKWIKITTDIFDDEKICMIECLPDADSLIVIWFKLLCLAGKQNNSGVFMFNDRIPYTDKMLATVFRRKESTVALALKTFEEFGMIEVIDGVITIPNWGKHQNLDQLEKKKNYMQNYMREYRKKQKLLAEGSGEEADVGKVNCKTNSKANVSRAEGEGDKERERDKEGEGDKDVTVPKGTVCRTKDVRHVIDEWNKTDFRKIERISPDSQRGSMTRKRINDYGIEKVVEAIHRANESKFLKGFNSKGWSADYSWFIRPENFQKVLEGNYDDREIKKNGFGKKSLTFMDIDIGGKDGESRSADFVDTNTG